MGAQRSSCSEHGLTLKRSHLRVSHEQHWEMIWPCCLPHRENKRMRRNFEFILESWEGSGQACSSASGIVGRTVLPTFSYGKCFSKRQSCYWSCSPVGLLPSDTSICWKVSIRCRLVWHIWCRLTSGHHKKKLLHLFQCCWHSSWS